jgi:hypothetical protein
MIKFSIKVAFKKTKNKIYWVHTLRKCAAQAYVLNLMTGRG